MKKLLIAALVLLSAQLSAQSLSTFTKDYTTFDTIYKLNDTVFYLLNDEAKFIDFIVEEHGAYIGRKWEDNDAFQVSYYTEKYFILLSLYYDGDTIVSVGRPDNIREF